MALLPLPPWLLTPLPVRLSAKVRSTARAGSHQSTVLVLQTVLLLPLYCLSTEWPVHQTRLPLLDLLRQRHPPRPLLFQASPFPANVSPLTPMRH